MQKTFPLFILYTHLYVCACFCVSVCVCAHVCACVSVCHSQVVHIAGIGHLLQVHAHGLRRAGVAVDDPVLHHVLEVGEAAPDVAQVVHGVRPGSRVPVPGSEHGTHQPSMNTSALSRSGLERGPPNVMSSICTSHFFCCFIFCAMCFLYPSLFNCIHSYNFFN